jgi:hypothetical protein
MTWKHSTMMTHKHSRNKTQPHQLHLLFETKKNINVSNVHHRQNSSFGVRSFSHRQQPPLPIKLRRINQQLQEQPFQHQTPQSINVFCSSF